jgi:tRNA(Ile)-lysidine synthase
LDDGELQIIRPLLSLTRAEIETFLTENQINWRFDQSNESRDYTRNRIRLDLLPLLKEQYNPNVVASLLQLGQTAEDVQSIIVVDAGYSLKELMVEEQADSIRLDAEELQTKPRIEQAEIIREAMEKLHIPQRQIGFKQMASILALLASPDEKKTLQLPAGWQVERNQRFLTLRKKGHPSILTDTESGSIIPDYPVQLSGQTSPPPGFIYIDSQNQQQPAAMIQTQILDGTKQTLDEFRKTKQANEEMLDYDAIKGSLVLRPWREGDRFGPLGAAGDKTLGDFFTDVKLASQWRKYIGLICDEEGILWVMGLRIAERVKISSQTKHILKLRVG